MRIPLSMPGADTPVCVVGCDSYEREKVKAALTSLLAPLGGLDFVRPGVKVAIKANLVAGMKPEAAATTHPVLLSVLAEEILSRGGSVVIGDSPGGLFTSAYLNRIYDKAGLRPLEAEGITLNQDLTEKNTAYPEGKVLKSLTYTGYLDDCDYIINVAKLKSHGMMGMSCAAKNMFGSVPGLLKPEYHYRFPRYEDFADMLLDLDQYFCPVISLADGILGMEGNGPTAGEPRQIGCLLASASPHCLDLAAAAILGMKKEDVPTLEAAYRRGLIPANVEELSLIGDISGLVLSDFKRVADHTSLAFTGTGKGPIAKIKGAFLSRVLTTKPALKSDLCVGCGVCAGICPAKAIVIEKGKAKIDRQKCIRCFCCQEFCPKSAMKVKSSWLMQLLHRK